MPGGALEDALEGFLDHLVGDAADMLGALGRRLTGGADDQRVFERVKAAVAEGGGLANVHVGGTHVNRELVAKGLAWRYVQYDKRGEFTQVEQAAKAARKGLWADPKPVPPWEWRKGEKERKAARKGAGVGR